MLCEAPAGADAEALFEGCGHAEGRALNVPWGAAVARTIAVGASQSSYVGRVERLIESAYAGCEDLHSPAGIVACAVKEGRVQMLRSGSGHLPRVVSRLKALLSKRPARVVEHDPWVPRLLTSFAEDEELVDRSREVLLAGRRDTGPNGGRPVWSESPQLSTRFVLGEDDEIEPVAAVAEGGRCKALPTRRSGPAANSWYNRQ